MKDMEDCIFCKIALGEIPAEKVYETPEVLAFLDIRPNNPGHTLVIPKKHYKNVLDIPEDLWISVMKAAHTLAPVIKKSMNADGINITTNNEAAAHQVVLHSHVHIIPRFIGDPHQPWVGTPYKDGEAEKVAEKIKAAL